MPCDGMTELWNSQAHNATSKRNSTVEFSLEFLDDPARENSTENSTLEFPADLRKQAPKFHNSIIPYRESYVCVSYVARVTTSSERKVEQ